MIAFENDPYLRAKYNEIRELGRIQSAFEEAKRLEKREAELRKLNQTVSKFDRSIDFLLERRREQYAMLDYYELQQAGCTSTGREWVKWQNKIISLKNQIAATEAKLSDAQFKKSEAERKLSA